MPKLPRAQKIANSVALILTARLSMCIVGAFLVPGAAIAGKLFYDKLVELSNGQIAMQIAFTKLEGSIERLQLSQQLAGAERDRAIGSLNERLTFVERQARK